ncbi:PREDICTED: cyclic nucleotide-gated cation channel alpha-3-like isoform X1 [Branchiostoma belcheri]|uniref:Cyclic nucleotide-gated cation channel alpha-3-like isoform X1 n=2 Tax=Branchiostoma belcheri TaxID=7741 RepID=A0A6P4ZYM0_BRABE|nr:PREDICTED: cyclic nucleotide-gated cation channel alpha-3-like isoform X1 [Branchiostoma belcheri]
MAGTRGDVSVWVTRAKEQLREESQYPGPLLDCRPPPYSAPGTTRLGRMAGLVRTRVQSPRRNSVTPVEGDDIQLQDIRVKNGTESRLSCGNQPPSSEDEGFSSRSGGTPDRTPGRSRLDSRRGIPNRAFEMDANIQQGRGKDGDVTFDLEANRPNTTSTFQSNLGDNKRRTHGNVGEDIGSTSDLSCDSDQEEAEDSEVHTDDIHGALVQTAPDQVWWRKVFRRTFSPEPAGLMLFWMVVVTLAVLYNSWTIPVRGSFADLQNNYSGAWFFLDYLCDIIYIIDIYICFRTWFLKDGAPVTDAAAITKRYKRSPFLFVDIGSILPLDLLYPATGVNPFLRIGRVLRLYRLYGFTQRVELRIRWPNVWRMALTIHNLMLVLHYNACLYYLVSLGEGLGQTSGSWSFLDPVLFPDYSALSRKYVHCLYRSTASLTLVGGLPHPETNGQYIYAVLQCILGLFLVAYVIGQVGCLMFHRKLQRFEFEKLVQNSRQLMQQNDVAKETQEKVQRFYDYSWANAQVNFIDEAMCLKQIPEPLRRQVTLSPAVDKLKQIPLFKDCEAPFLEDLGSRLKSRLFSPGDFVCKAGEIGRETYFVVQGVLEVISENDDEVSRLTTGSVVGEESLLNPYRGSRRSADVVSTGFSQLLLLTNSDVVETMYDHPASREAITVHSRRRLQDVLSLPPESAGNDSGFRSRRDSVTPLSYPDSLSISLARRMSDNQLTSLSKYRKRFRRVDSNDSCVPPSPLAQSFVAPSSSRSRRSGMLEPIPIELVDRLAAAYEQNARALKCSIDSVLDREVRGLRQRLQEADQDREARQIEIAMLRKKLKEKDTYSTADVRNQPGEEAQVWTRPASGTRAVGKRRRSDHTIVTMPEEPEPPTSPSPVTVDGSSTIDSGAHSTTATENSQGKSDVTSRKSITPVEAPEKLACTASTKPGLPLKRVGSPEDSDSGLSPGDNSS